MSATTWLLLNIFSLFVLAFYSMIEMACVSFNKLRLQYYVQKGEKRAEWLNRLLHNPSRLFGTTLIGVNVAMIFGSECARQFHSSLGINPDLAPLSQVMIVIVLGELAPIFAARHYSEHVAFLGAPILYFSAKLLFPFLWAIHYLSLIVNKLVGGSTTDREVFLTQEELLKTLQEDEDTSEGDEINDITTNIFILKNRSASEIMEPISSIPKLSCNATIAALQKLLRKRPLPYVPLFYNHTSNIVGITIPRELTQAPSTKRLKECARSPWFLTKKTKAMQILKQFQSNNQTVAVVLNDEGSAVGLITLDDLIDEIFGHTSFSKEGLSEMAPKPKLYIDRTFSGETQVAQLEKMLKIPLSKNKEMTLSQLLTKTFGHHPDVGETLSFPPFEVTVEEISLLEVKKARFTGNANPKKREFDVRKSE